MALINCPECGKEISNNAKSCPNCGYSLGNRKFCKHCGELIDDNCVVCPKCGKQVEELNSSSDKNIIINNNNNNNVSASASASASANVYRAPGYRGRRKDKWIALLLCIFTICGHKFYEGKIGMGILYFLTAGLFGIGWIFDIIQLAMKPNPYYV